MSVPQLEEPGDLEFGASTYSAVGKPAGRDGRRSSLGQATQMQIVYKDLNYTVQVKEKATKEVVRKPILKGVEGVIRPGRITAVMGASGAGKTTFLNVLAGFQKHEADLTGDIRVNGQVMPLDGDHMRKISGFVHQEDVILDTMTVHDALLFSAQLRLPKTMSRAEKERRAMDVADLLNLRKALDNLVGSALLKGISGGEKRRLSLGMEMITNPSILFLDEPTSGLDSFTAYKVGRILGNVAHKYGRTIVCTIHQPSSEVFSLFDDLIVLTEGQVVYHGPTASMVTYFAKLGYSCPNNFNPADFLFMEILHAGGFGGTDDQYDFLADKEEDSAHRAQAKEAEAQRIKGIISTWANSPERQDMLKFADHENSSQRGVDASAIQSQASFLTQFRLLGLRSGRNAWRNQLIIKGKLGQTVFLAIIVGLIYLRLGHDVKSIQDRQGSLFFIVVQGLFGSVFGTLTVFGGEKAVFQREFGSRMYNLPAYFISRTLVQLPSNIIMPIISSAIMYWLIGYQKTAEKFAWFTLIVVLMDNCGAALGVFVSCLFNDINVALTVLPAFLLPLMVFSGFFVNSESLGWWFRWISYISPMKYGFIALIKNEFTGLTVNCDSAKDTGCKNGVRYGEDVITLMGFDDLGSKETNAGILFALMWGFLLLGYVSLWVVVRRTKA